MWKTCVSTTPLFFLLRAPLCSPHATPPSGPLVCARTQAEVRQLYQTLAGDDMPMVRKAAFVATGPLATVLKKEHVKEVVLPALKARACVSVCGSQMHLPPTKS